MNTRRFLSLMGVVMAWAPPVAWAQQAARLPTVGILSPGHQADRVCLPGNQGGGVACFLQALLALGYSDGRNVRFEYRFAEGATERLPALAAELVALRPDVIYTFTTAGADAAAKPARPSPSWSARPGSERWSGWPATSQGRSAM